MGGGAKLICKGFYYVYIFIRPFPASKRKLDDA